MEFPSKTTVPLASPGQLLADWMSNPVSFVISWPPRSSDLNPIVHLWEVLEQGVKGHHTAPTNLTELLTVLANIWQVIPVKCSMNLCLVVCQALSRPEEAELISSCGVESKDKNWTFLNKDPSWVPGGPRKAAVAHFRLLIGHDCLISHLYRIGISNSPDCTLLLWLTYDR
ncbi:hypothetical protein TNCV_4276541 [Trichonephila clavipes]|nr:hypothetical protein TNCV_4276541 [Trichonephila clavipes]